MNWFWIAFIAPVLWAMVNIADQYLVRRFSEEERGSGGLVLFSSLIGLFVALGIGIFQKGIFSIPHTDIALLILNGGMTIAWVIFYLFAIEIEDVSTIAPWFLTIPVFGYVLGYIFLGETLSQIQLLGSLIIIIGLIILSFDFSKKKITSLKVVFYMTLACFLISVMGIIFKYVTVEGNYWVSSFWEYFGLGIFGILIYIFVPKYRREFNHMNKVGGKRIFALNTISETVTMVGNFLTNYAYLLAPVVMVYFVGSFQPAILLIMTIICTKFFPKIIKENMEKKILIQKIFAIIVMTVGSFILFI